MAIISTAYISEARTSQRLDAEFFDPSDLALIEKLKSEGGVSVGSVCDVLNGRTPQEYTDDGPVPVVRSGDLVAPFIYPECKQPFLRTLENARLIRLVKGDVLISSIGMGSIGKISLVMDAGNFVTVSEVTILRAKSYSPAVLFAYLTTAAGQRQICRQITGATGQQHLLKSKVETILVPAIPSEELALAVENACQRAWELEKEASNQLERAHATFSAGIGIAL